jgi:sialate O-acetylesterase
MTGELPAMQLSQMSYSRRLLCLLILLAGFAPEASRAEVRLPKIFGSDMVLQSGKSVKIWGWASEGELVVVQFRGQVKSTRAIEGKWSVMLSPMRAGNDPNTLAVLADNTIELKNVVVGEVWLASGQSNMQWSLARSEDWTKAAASSSNPNLRLFYVPRIKSERELDDLEGQHLDNAPRWELAGPGSTPEFSAVAYYFGRDLQKALNVPVGIIHSSWGGSPAEVWMSEKMLTGRHADLLEAHQKRAKKYSEEVQKFRVDQAAAKAEGKVFKRRAPRKGWVPGELYNSMIHPLLPFAMKGAIWYQGESNAGRAHEYRALFSNMIRDWRAGWNQGDFPFLAVELAPYDMRRNRTLEEIARKPVDSNWGELREAQILASKVLPKVATVTITDFGTKDDIHPPMKEPVGIRLALAARGLAYGEDVISSGPSYRSHRVWGGRVTISFNHLGEGLEARAGRLTGFAIAGDDQVFVWGNAEIVGNTVVVTHPNIKKPAGVRFGWADYPVVNLWSRNGLPAHPFRTDNFPLTTAPKQ